MRGSVALAAIALAFGAMTVSRASHADIWGYIDDAGRSHLASEKLDDRYTLFFKGGVRVDAAGAIKDAVPESAGAGPTAPAPVEAVAQDVAPRELPAMVTRFEPLINRYAKMHNIDPALVKAVIAVESAFQPGVVSAKGALGLMQIIPDTGARYGVTGDRRKSQQQKLFDPATNLMVGTRYLRDLLGMFAQNVELALAAYNAGEGSVMKYNNQVPPFAETRDYVKKVQKLYADLRPPAPVAPVQAKGPAKPRLLLPGQRVPNAGLVPVAADPTVPAFPQPLPAASVTTGSEPTS